MSSVFSKPKAPKPDQNLIDAQNRRDKSLREQSNEENLELESRKRALSATRRSSATLFDQTGVKGVSSTLGG